MDDSDFEIEDYVGDSSFSQDAAGVFSEFETLVDRSDSATDIDISIWEDDRSDDSDQELDQVSSQEISISQASVLSQLEEFVLYLMEQLQQDKLPIQLSLTKKDSSSKCTQRILKWPTKSKSGGIKNFVCLFRVIELVQEAIMCDVPMTKREIYYRDVALFKNQTVVNDLIELIAHTLDVPRKSLNVRASAKGLFCGSGLKIGLKRGDTIQGTDSEGLLIPPSEEIAWLKISDTIAWVLVVEKETVFQCLSKTSFVSGNHALGPGIIITGKGYPDFATLELTKQLSLMLPESVPIGAIMDCDPYGLEIYSMYKFGGGAREECFATSRIEWLGIWTTDILSVGIHRDSLLPLTAHDTKKCLELLTRRSFDMTPQWKRELSRMMVNRRKAEIEILLSNPLNQTHTVSESGSSFLHHYLLVKMKNLIMGNQKEDIMLV